MMKRKILGISAFYHDSAAAIIVDGEIIAAAQEERFTRKKHCADFPSNAIRYCLEESGLSLKELDAIVFYDKPFLKFERLLETYYAFAPKGLLSFLKAIPVWLDEKLFLKNKIFKELQAIESFNKREIQLLFPEHHLSHAASAFFASPFKQAAILTIDGVGEWTTASISIGKENSITFLKEMHFPHSVGLLYSSFTYFLGFKVNSGEYKLMGLAPYGNPQSEQTHSFINIIKEKIVHIKDDGSIWLNPSYFSYATGLKMIPTKKWEQLFNISIRKDTDEILQTHCNLALAIQSITEEIVLRMAKNAHELSNSDNLCLAGGVALNCVANGKILEQNLFKNIYIQPAAGDAGGAIGAALAVYYLYYNEERVLQTPDAMQGAYLGPHFSDKEIMIMNKKNKAVYHSFHRFEDLCEQVAEKIHSGNVVGWFQGRMEFGPRALGNRSILGNASDNKMQQKINLKIKKREGFRPFAPAIVEEDMKEYFNLNQPSPYMLFVVPVNEDKRNSLPNDYYQLSLKNRLNCKRSEIPAVTHIDYSARVQTVNKEINPHFYQLLQSYKKLSGKGILINTSFNLRGEPIVCTPFDAYRCFMSTDMDYLVIENYLYKKEEQPDYKNQEKWQLNFEKD